MTGCFPPTRLTTNTQRLVREHSPSEMEGGGLSVTTAVVLSETGSAEIGPVALTLCSRNQCTAQEDASASVSRAHHVPSLCNNPT